MKPAPLLEEYERLLRERAVPLGLISARDAAQLRSRHIDDSLRAVDAFREEDRRCFDLGSGAGLPGIPLAIALPDREFVLIESRSRRVGFLELAVDVLQLRNVSVLAARAEEAGERVARGEVPPADLATARAFAPIDRTWRAAAPLVRPGGRVVYFAGRGFRDPAGAARAAGADQVSVLDSGAPLVIMVRP